MVSPAGSDSSPGLSSTRTAASSRHSSRIREARADRPRSRIPDADCASTATTCGSIAPTPSKSGTGPRCRTPAPSSSIRRVQAAIGTRGIGSPSNVARRSASPPMRRPRRLGDVVRKSAFVDEASDHLTSAHRRLVRRHGDPERSQPRSSAEAGIDDDPSGHRGGRSPDGRQLRVRARAASRARDRSPHPTTAWHGTPGRRGLQRAGRPGAGCRARAWRRAAPSPVARGG